MEERLREAEERLGRSRPEMAARERELEVRTPYYVYYSIVYVIVMAPSI
jgi:hypothetical protein